MENNGRPSILTEELTLKIRQGVLDEKDYKEIQQELDISPNTWDTWVYKDYNGFRTKLNQWKHERMVKKATNKVEQLVFAEDERVALNASTFILETLDKINYSKKTETDITSGGKPIIHIAGEIAEKNLLNATNTLTSENS